MGIPFRPGASVGTGDMPSVAVKPGGVSVAPPLRYLAPVAGRSQSSRNKAKVMVISINLLTVILSFLSQKDSERLKRPRGNEGGGRRL